MPVQPNIVNIVDMANSSSIPLGAFATFVGRFVDVTNYASITISLKSDVATPYNGLTIDWSTNGITADLEPQHFTQDPAVTGLHGITVKPLVRGAFYRVSYQNNFTPQAAFVLTSLLSQTPPTGTVRTIDPVNTFINNVDAQISQAIFTAIGRFNAQQLLLPMSDDVNAPNDGPFLFVSPRPAKALVRRNKIAAKILEQTLTPNFGPSERATYICIFNDSIRGILYLRLDTQPSGLSPTNYDFKVPPQHTWICPAAISPYSGEIQGLWDVADGTAFFSENVYG